MRRLLVGFVALLASGWPGLRGSSPWRTSCARLLRFRKLAQFLFEQLLEVALRALSPGVNDPITALRCCGRIAGQLALLARRERPSPYRFGAGGALRVIAPALEPEELVPHPFGPLRTYGQRDAMTLSHLLRSLGRMGELVPDEGFRRALREEAERVRETAQAGLSASDCARFLDDYRALERQLAP